MDIGFDLPFLLESARLAGAQATARIRLARPTLRPADVSQKASGDWATRFDREVEKSLRESLQQTLPQARFVGEKIGGELTDIPTWLVDPIDGMANFARDYPQYAVSIALCVGRQPVPGVIFDASRDEIFTAASGLGATLNVAAHRMRIRACRRQVQGRLGRRGRLGIAARSRCRNAFGGFPPIGKPNAGSGKPYQHHLAGKFSQPPVS